MLREIGNIFIWISIALLVFGYIWSIIISWRVNKGLFAVVFLLWIIGYPILLAIYWKQSKKTLFVILAGLASFTLAFALLAGTHLGSKNGIIKSYAKQYAPTYHSTAMWLHVDVA